MRDENLVLDVNERPKKWYHWGLYAIQHILAMLVACITVPMLTGLPIGATITAAGVGTLIYLLITKFKSPVFLSSSFAFLAPMYAALTLGTAYAATSAGAQEATAAGATQYWYLAIGMSMVGLVYVIIAFIVKFTGTKWLNKLLPPVVIGPIIMVIGLSLAGSAIGNINSVTSFYDSSNNLLGQSSQWLSILIALVGVFVTAICAHYGKKTLSTIPFFMGMVVAYAVAAIFTIIGIKTGNYGLQVLDWSSLTGNSWGTWKGWINTDWMFTRIANSTAQFEVLKLIDLTVLFVPVALVTVCEHIGDHKNLGNIIGKDLLTEEPGMTRTLLGDGIATAVSGSVCGAGNTTYGENVGVVGVTKVASSSVILVAAILAVLIGVFKPITLVLSTIPFCICGGVSMILYGFIASSGVKMLQAEKVDFNKSKNIMIASVILVAGIGGFAMTFKAGSYTIELTSIVVAMILGIMLNLILVEKKEKITVEEKVCCEECCAPIVGETVHLVSEPLTDEVKVETVIETAQTLEKAEEDKNKEQLSERQKKYMVYKRDTLVSACRASSLEWAGKNKIELIYELDSLLSNREALEEMTKASLYDLFSALGIKINKNDNKALYVDAALRFGEKTN